MFFETEGKIKVPLSLVPKCGVCGYCKKTEYPKVKPIGNNAKRILFITKGVQPNGDFLAYDEKKHLEGILDSLGVSLSRDCQITGMYVCPDKGVHPKSDLNDYCFPNVMRILKDDEHDVVFLLGAETLPILKKLWKDSAPQDINKWRGWCIPSQVINKWVIPLYSISDLFGDRKGIENLIFKNDLKKGLKKKKPPFENVPNYEKEIVLEYDNKSVRKFVNEIIAAQETVAFDLETTMLKPDHAKSRIVCCSLSNGEKTICFPWNKETSLSMATLLSSPDCGKIASNLKFEHRWIKRKLGINVTNWEHDTMLASHLLDNRGGISSIKFQSFVLLGQPDYDSDVHSFLTSSDKGGYAINTIDRAPVKALMTYCGLDSLLEYRVARLQQKLLNQG